MVSLLVSASFTVFLVTVNSIAYYRSGVNEICTGHIFFRKTMTVITAAAGSVVCAGRTGSLWGGIF